MKIYFLLAMSALVLNANGSERKNVNDSTLLVNICEGVSVKWNLTNDHVILDDNLRLIKGNLKLILEILEEVGDTTSMNLSVCSKDKILVKGDVAFLLLHYLNEIPMYSCTKIQFDFTPPNCFYAEGLLNYVHKNRQLLIGTLKDCIEEKYK